MTSSTGDTSNQSLAYSFEEVLSEITLATGSTSLEEASSRMEIPKDESVETELSGIE